jgi:hypothetical protein
LGVDGAIVKWYNLGIISLSALLGEAESQQAIEKDDEQEE